MRISEFKYEIKGNVKSMETVVIDEKYSFWFFVYKNVKLTERLEPVRSFSLRLNSLRRET